MTKFDSAYTPPPRCFGTPCPTDPPAFDGPMCESVFPDSVRPSRAGETSLRQVNATLPEVVQTGFTSRCPP